MSIATRIQAYSARHPISMNRKVDIFLSENLADLMAEYKIADRSDLNELDGKFEVLESRMDNLDVWKANFTDRLKDGKARMERLKMKAGIE
jgi:hypothetical protein